MPCPADCVAVNHRHAIESRIVGCSHADLLRSFLVTKEVRRLVNESTFAPGGGQPGMTVGSVAVRTFESRRSEPNTETQPAYAMAPFNDNDLQDGQFYDPDAEYEPDPEYAATLAPDAARQRRERVGPTGRPLPYFPIPNPLSNH